MPVIASESITWKQVQFDMHRFQYALLKCFLDDRGIIELNHLTVCRYMTLTSLCKKLVAVAKAVAYHNNGINCELSSRKVFGPHRWTSSSTP